MELKDKEKKTEDVILENLSFFKTVQVPQALQPTFKQFEDILQQQHDESGRHRTCSDSEDGFMTVEHNSKLNQLWEWFLKNQEKDA